jgi:hypothetical protein
MPWATPTPRTTRAYYRSRHRLDNHATYAIAAWLRRAPTNAAASEVP